MSDGWCKASAPGKFVILGEHAVVYGKPAVVLAVDMRMTISVRESRFNTINGEKIDFRRQPHLRYLTRDTRHAIDIRTESGIPVGSGLGSSAALSAAMALALDELHHGSMSEQELVEEAYGAELFAQGNGSPMDASACVHGGGIAINLPSAGNKHLWTIERGERRWSVADVDVPDMTFVIGNTGIKAPTGPLVDKVRRFINHSSFAADMIDVIEDVTVEGSAALARKDVEGLGRLMTEDHKLLSILGVSSPELNKLVNAALPYSYGAKLTGAGGGGCMIALTDSPDKVCKAIEARGGKSYVVKTGVPGAMLHPS